jgi:hypothetical protein
MASVGISIDKSKCKKEKVGIFLDDEASIRLDLDNGTIWSLKVLTPLIDTTEAPCSMNMISSVNNRGLMLFMIFVRHLNSDTFIEFLKRLIHNLDYPTYLFAGGHPTQKSTKVKNFLRFTKRQLKLFYLLSYSPEQILN